MRNWHLLVGLSLVFSSSVHAETAIQWPSFQGPAGTAWRADDLPLTWSPDTKVAWSTAVPGYGQSSPVAWQQRLFVTSVSGRMKERCHVTALDVKTGAVVWQREMAAASQAENSNYISKAAPTPVVDAERLIVFFEGGNLAAFTHDGQVLWERDLVKEFGELTSRHGLGSSLLQSGDRVVVWVERQTDPYVLAIDKSTGQTRWKAAGLSATSWSTPALLAWPDGTAHFVLSGSGMIAGYDLRSGEQRWKLEGIVGNTIPTPQAYAPGRLLVGATVGRGESTGGKAAESNGSVAIERTADGGFKADYAWRSQRATCSFGSPIVHEGLAYFVNATGVLFCLDAATGEEIYYERLGDSVWATPLAIGNRIYFAGRSGKTTVVATGREFRKLAENHLWAEEAAAPAEKSPAASSSANTSPAEIQYAMVALPDRLLLRTGSRVICLKK
ncbi:MAG: PQQ-binding-like beta-propeller repeat protein [Pirellulaceae bacterium]